MFKKQFSATRRLGGTAVSGPTGYNPQECEACPSLGRTKQQGKSCVCTEEGAINPSDAGGYENRPQRMEISTDDIGIH